MKIVSPLAMVAAVLLTVLVVGCSSGPGKAPDEETPTPPAVQVFSGTFTVLPDPTNPLMGTITATITGISLDGTDVDAAALAGVLAQLELSSHVQTFDYTLATTLEGTTIMLTGDLLTALVPGGSVTATRSVPATDPATALIGTWTYELTDPQTMVVATTLTLETTAPNSFKLTVDSTPPSS